MGFLKRFFRNVLREGTVPTGTSSFERLSEEELETHLGVAKYGDFTRGPRIVNETVREEMEEILAEIQDGSFAKEWILENQAGRPVFNALKKMDEESLIEEVGQELRGMMPWMKKK